jgi:Protein of unknown function (DUF2939)
MSVLSSSTTAVHTFGRLTSNCAIRAAGKRCHAQDDSKATVIILGLVWIGYTAWPIYDLLVLVRAMETRDVHTVTQHVYFDAVRVSLTNQVIAAYIRRTGVRISPLAQSMAGALGIASTIWTIWQIFGNSEYGLAQFEVMAPFALPQQQRFRLTFRLLQWRWRLVAIALPENIQNLLGEQLAKTLRTPVQNQ